MAPPPEESQQALPPTHLAPEGLPATPKRVKVSDSPRDARKEALRRRIREAQELDSMPADVKPEPAGSSSPYRRMVNEFAHETFGNPVVIDDSE